MGILEFDIPEEEMPDMEPVVIPKSVYHLRVRKAEVEDRKTDGTGEILVVDFNVVSPGADTDNSPLRAWFCLPNPGEWNDELREDKEGKMITVAHLHIQKLRVLWAALGLGNNPEVGEMAGRECDAEVGIRKYKPDENSDEVRESNEVVRFI